jgi:hypothetical protein
LDTSRDASARRRDLPIRPGLAGRYNRYAAGDPGVATGLNASVSDGFFGIDAGGAEPRR